jgi:hypothetical protein
MMRNLCGAVCAECGVKWCLHVSEGLDRVRDGHDGEVEVPKVMQPLPHAAHLLNPILPGARASVRGGMGGRAGALTASHVTSSSEVSNGDTISIRAVKTFLTNPGGRFNAKMAPTSASKGGGLCEEGGPV